MGNYHGTDKDKKMDLSHKLSLKSQRRSTELDVSIVPPTLKKSSKKVKKKKLERCKRVDYFQYPSEVTPIESTNNISELAYIKVPKNSESFSCDGPNGSQTKQIQKQTLLQRAQSSEYRCFINEISIDKKERASKNVSKENENFKDYEDNADNSIRVFPRYLGEQRKFEIDDRNAENKGQKTNIIFEKSKFDKKQVSENNNSSVDNNPDKRLVTFDKKDEKIYGLSRLKIDISKNDKVIGKIRPNSLPIADDHKVKLRYSMLKKLEQVDIVGIKSCDGKNSDCHVEDEKKYVADKSGKSARRCSKDSLIFLSKIQKSNTIAKTLQKLKVSPLDSKLHLPDFFEMGINTKRELYKTDGMVDLLLKPGTLLNLIGCYGSGKSEISSLVGLQIVKHKKYACLTIDCHGCKDERGILRRLLRIFNLNFSPLPDSRIDDAEDDYFDQFNELINCLSNYLCFHGQIQQIVLMFDSLNMESCYRRNCVDGFIIPLLKRSRHCLSILLCSDVNLLDVPEVNLILNEQMPSGPSKLDSAEERMFNKNEIMDEEKQMHAFRLSQVFKFNDVVGNFVSDYCPLVDDGKLKIFGNLESNHNLTLNSWKMLIRAASLKPKSINSLMEKVESCTHPSLILLENEFVTKQEAQNMKTAHVTNHGDDPFSIEKLNASVVLATLETLDDDDQTMSTILWLMSDFKSGFDLESVSFSVIANKALDDDLNLSRVKLSEMIELDSFDNLKEQHSKITNALEKLVKVGLLQIVKLPVTFSSPLSSRRTSLNDQIAKPCRLLLDQKQGCFSIGSSVVSQEISPQKYRIPNSVMPIISHLKPEYLGRPILMLDYIMAKKLKTLYRMFYSVDSFGNTFNEIDPIHSDLFRCLERNFEFQQDMDELRSSADFKVNHPLVHVCFSLVSLPGAFFLAQILPLSTYMKIFSGISKIMKQRLVIRDLTNAKECSIEYRALLCIILRHKMASAGKEYLGKAVYKADGLQSNPIQFLKPEPNQSNESEWNNKQADCPTNLYNFKEGIRGMSNLNEASVTEMISRIKFLLFQVNKCDKAFFYYIMSVHLWSTDKDQAVALMKKSLDFFKESGPDGGDEIVPNLGQVNIQIVSETYSWMLISIDKVQAARHIYNLTDSNSSSSSSSPPLTSQSSFPPTTSSSSSSYYSLHSHHGLSPSSVKNDEDVSSLIGNYCNLDKRGNYGPGGDCRNLLVIVKEKKDDHRFHVFANKNDSLDSNDDSLVMLTQFRSTLKSIGDFNHQRSVTARSLVINKLDVHPLKLRGLEFRRRIWSELGLLARARDTAKSCVDLSKQWWGLDHPSTAEALMGLCLVAEKLGRNHEAVDACVQALISRLKFYGDKHASSVDSCTVLSRLLLKCSMYNECLELARRSLNMTTHLTPPEDDRVVEIVRIIGVVEKKMKLGRQKKDSMAITKSVTFHPESLLIEGHDNNNTSARGVDNKPKDVCSSIICKFDPELAQTFHRCIHVPTIA